MQQTERTRSNRRPALFAAVAFLLGAALAFAGITLVSATGDSDAVVTVNGEPITREAFFKRLELHAGEEVLDQMIAEMLVVQSASRFDGVDATAEEIQAEIDKIKAGYESEEAFLDAMARFNITLEELERDVRLNIMLKKLTRRGVEVTEEEIQQYYNEYKDLLGRPEQVQVRHILVETKEEAESLRVRLLEGEDFAELAMSHSIDTGSAEQGGLLGYLHAGSPVVPAFRDAALKLQVGQVSEPVQTEFGWHLIRGDERLEAFEPTLDEARDLVREPLIDEKARPVSDVLTELWTDSVVEVHWPRYEMFAHDPKAN